MSASGDWGPAPPGVDLTEVQDGEILRPVIALMTLGILAVATRLVARFKAGAKIAVDDYLILASLVSLLLAGDGLGSVSIKRPCRLSPSALRRSAS
jgi:hypothetical protein